MLKAYKYRIYPNSEQRIQIAKTFGCCRFVYNQTLAYRKEIYEKEKKSVSKTDCNNYCNRELKKDYEWLKEIDKFALTNAIYNMNTAYQKFFKEHAGYPKFKSKHDNHKSYTTNFTNGNIAVDFETGKIKLPKLKAVKAKSLNAEGSIPGAFFYFYGFYIRKSCNEINSFRYSPFISCCVKKTMLMILKTFVVIFLVCFYSIN